MLRHVADRRRPNGASKNEMYEKYRAWKMLHQSVGLNKDPLTLFC